MLCPYLFHINAHSESQKQECPEQCFRASDQQCTCYPNDEVIDRSWKIPECRMIRKHRWMEYQIDNHRDIQVSRRKVTDICQDMPTIAF